MALIPEVSNQQSASSDAPLHAQSLSQRVHDQVTLSDVSTLNRISPNFGGTNPGELQIPPYHYPDVQPISTLSTAPGEEHGLQFRAPAPETPPLTAKQLGQELTTAMESHDPKSMDKFEDDLYKAIGNSDQLGTGLLISQINDNMPKGMGIEMTDDEPPNATDDFHHYSLHFLQQVNSGGNFQSGEYGTCEQAAPPMMLSSTPEWAKHLNGFRSNSAPEIID